MGKTSKEKHRNRSNSRERKSHESRKSHKKKDRKRHYSDSSRSSSSSQEGRRSKKNKHRSRERRSDSRERRPLTVAEMERQKEEKRKEKELVKSLETPEEKRARRLAKKDAKERKRKEKMGWDEEYMGYTNVDNPFGDEHLLDHFVWGKKLEREGKKHLGSEEIIKLQRQKMLESKMELEKVKKRRLEREREMAERDQESELMQREKEADYFREWEKQEDSFHLNQAKLRSKIRIDDGRAKPIDLLAKYICMDDDDFDVEMHEPYFYLSGLTMQDLEDLLEDIKVYIELEQGKNADFWKDMTIVTEEELNKLRKLDPDSRDYVGDRRTGINTSVMDDVSSVFKGKTLNQLEILQDQIKKKLTGGQGVDVGYWETLLHQLKAHMARSRLREKHQEQLRRRLFKLKQEQGIGSEPLFPILRQDSPSSVISGASTARNSPRPEASVKTEMVVSEEDATATQPNPVIPPPIPDSLQQNQDPQPGTSSQLDDQEVKENDEPLITEEDLVEQSYVDYEAGGYSPNYLQNKDLDADTIVYNPEDDMKRLEFARRQLQKTGRAKSDIETEFEKKAREGMDRDEAQFSVEVPIEQTLAWSDKYRPRKPRFFNRVHTGFEWNKYNQTHYDIDNPPPKIVQGYKFNIFFPDLIDKTKTPEYTLTPIEDSPDFATLRFRAGPPYEDIGFKIVNREWEYSYKRGFRCQFHNNIFQLWFHFKRYRYRR